MTNPRRARSDLHFVLFGFPVRIHPLFWLMALVLGYNSGGAKEVAAWVAAVLIAILVHEWGHALAMRGYGLRPSITLHGLGGVTSARDGQGFGPPLRMWEHVLISAAGPAAGFLLAAAVCGAVYLSGHGLRCEFGLPSGFMVGPAEVVGTPLLTVFIAYILFASVAWGLLNLLPVYPLDGGQIAREVLLAASAATKGCGNRCGCRCGRPRCWRSSGWPAGTTISRPCSSASWPFRAMCCCGPTAAPPDRGEAGLFQHRQGRLPGTGPPPHGQPGDQRRQMASR